MLSSYTTRRSLRRDSNPRMLSFGGTVVSCTRRVIGVQARRLCSDEGIRTSVLQPFGGVVSSVERGVTFFIPMQLTMAV